MVKKEYGRIEEKKKSSEEEEEGGMRDFPKNDRQEHVISSQSERVSIWDLYNILLPFISFQPFPSSSPAPFLLDGVDVLFFCC
jgi:hypothetical protein